MTTKRSQLNLFTPTTDDILRDTKKSDDEKEWERERSRRSKRNQVKAAPMPETGPCCGRCALWVEPEPGDLYGHCRIRVVTGRRILTATGIIEKGVCLGYDPLTQELEIGRGKPLVPLFGEVIEFEYQHCGPAWSCSGYVAAGEAREAA